MSTVSESDVLAGKPIDLRDAEPKNKRISATWLVNAIEGAVRVNIRGAIILDTFRLLPKTYTGEISLQNCVFEDVVDFSRATFKHALGLEKCEFKKTANFSGCVMDSDFAASGAIFGANTSFGHSRTRGACLLDGATFNGEANFDYAELGIAYFENAKFRDGQAEFVATKFRRAVFRGVRFEKGSRPTFRGARFEGEALFQGAVFEDKAGFLAARFETVANFDRESRKNTLFEGAIFNKAALFEFARFGGPALFEHARFKGDALFRGASFHALMFSPLGTVPSGNALPNEGKDVPQFSGNVDLSGSTYAHIDVSREALVKCWEGQRDPKKYNREQFVRLEKTLRASGADEDADHVYLARRRVERRVRFQDRRLGAWVASCVYNIVANYGVRPYRLGVAIFLLYVAGGFALSQPHAAEIKPDYVLARHSSNGRSGSDSPDSDAPTRYWLGFRLALRALLPVELPLVEEWEPSNERCTSMLMFSDVATCLKLAGWIIVPLGVAAIAGALRSKPVAGEE